MKRLLGIAALYIILFSAQGIAGQFYQYKDAGGTLIFTDDISQVPMDQRSGVRSYESIQSKEGDPPKKPAKDLKPDSIDPTSENNQEDINWIKEEETRLNHEKNALSAIKEDVNTPDKRAEYNRRVNALNQRIEVYKIKLEQLKKRLGQ